MSWRKQVLLVNYEELDIFWLNQICRLLHRCRLDIDYWEKCLNNIPKKNKKSLVIKRLRLAIECMDRELKDTLPYFPEKYKHSVWHYFYN